MNSLGAEGVESRSNGGSLSDYSNEELLDELSRRLLAASEELKMLRDVRLQSNQGPAERRLSESSDDLLAIINGVPSMEDDSARWNSETPHTSAKLLRKKAIVRLARVWARMALDPIRLRNGEINRRLMERETGIPRNTMRPYLDAGLKLQQAGRLYLDDDPTEVDFAIVEKSMNEGERQRRRAQA